MRKTIWKYKLNRSKTEVVIPVDSKVLCVKNQRNNIAAWVEVDSTETKNESIIFEPIKLRIESSQEIELPENCDIVSGENSNESPVIWIVYKSKNSKYQKRRFALVPTGASIKSKNYKYISTLQYNSGNIVQHLYEYFDYEDRAEYQPNVSSIKNKGEFIDKIKGVIYGHAIGDAIGLGTEFMTKEHIKYYYPNGYDNYQQIEPDKHRSSWKKGEWTDDTDQMLCILESIIAKKVVDEIDIAKRIHYWAFNGGRGIGQTVYKVITDHEFMFNPHKVSKKVWVASGNKAAANGAVMRTSILGVWDYNNQDKVKENSDKVSKITHYDPRCTGSSYIICYLISELIKGNTKNKELVKKLLEIAQLYDTRIEEYINLSTNKKIGKLKLDEQNSIGYTLKAMGAGIWALHQKDYKSAMLEIINEGGDADTNGAVAGAVLGAKFGYSKLPQNWVDGLLNKDKLNLLIDRFIIAMEETGQLN